MRQPRKNSFRRLALPLVLAGALATITAITAVPALAAPQKGLRITYLVFSGRPNPTLTLTDAKQVAEIENRLAATLARDSRPDLRPPEPVLGYNGILIEPLAGGEGAGAYVVQGDKIRPEGRSDKAAPTVAVSKEALEIEGLLLDLGRARGSLDEAMLSVIRGGS